MELSCQQLEDLYWNWIEQRHHASVLLESSLDSRWNDAQILMQAVIATGKSTEEVANFVMDTKHWFKTTSEYSQRTTSF